ncbi:MAG: lytic murein transglycosylase [Patescibacteria group bacterium]|nr:lytic murein transglycosylase [Patescibacteria group bacterium]
MVISTLFVSFLLFKPILAEENLEQICKPFLEEDNGSCGNMSDQECQVVLNKCLDYYQGRSDYYGDKVEETQKEKKTFQNQIYILRNKISGLNNEIYKSNLMVKDIGLQIKDTQASITVSTNDIGDAKEKLSELLRLVYEQDQRSLLEIMLAEEELSDFFDELANLEALSLRNQDLLSQIKGLKRELETEETALEGEKGDLEQLVVVRTLQKNQSQVLKKDQESLLKETKGREDLYQDYLKENEEKANEIRKQIFQLAQVSEEDAPSYEEAYMIAEYVETVTGVRAALVLGLLQVESAIGKNVGQCNCAGHASCRHPEIGWKEVMRNTNNQWDSFLKITKGLGLNPDTTPISCSISGGKVQWGGAMGPAQFMPNTWLNPKNPANGYKSKVEKITGKMANPWNVRDAFLAAGLYLKDWGAASQTLRKEVGAVTAYLCGSSYMTTICKNAGGYGYRNLVMEKAAQWEKWADEGVF